MKLPPEGELLIVTLKDGTEKITSAKPVTTAPTAISPRKM
jgi:hypothetical protein